MILQVGVKALLRNREGKYLLLKRAPSKSKGIDGTWDIVGGRIEVGTNLIDNLQREIREETNLELSSSPELIYAQDIFWKEHDTHVVRLTYIAEADGQPVLDMNENIEYRWVSIEEMTSCSPLDKYVQELINAKKIQ